MAWSDFWGSVAASGISYFGANATSSKSYRYSRALQDAQNSWMERMSNTAHQREVKDLRAAGLNPILSATGGNGASTPSAGGATFTAENPVNSALQAYMQNRQLKQQDTQLEQQGKKLAMDGEALNTQMSNLKEQTRAQKINNDLTEKYGDKKQIAEIQSILANRDAALASASSAKGQLFIAQQMLPYNIANVKEDTITKGSGNTSQLINKYFGRLFKQEIGKWSKKYLP